MIATALFVLSLVSAQPPASTASLVLDAFTPDGSSLSIYDVAGMTNYTPTPKSIIGENYGVYAMGQPPAANQIGTRIALVPLDSRVIISIRVPSNQPVYFTALWKAEGIGTVFMRADNAGSGYSVAPEATRVLQLPYEIGRAHV